MRSKFMRSLATFLASAIAFSAFAAPFTPGNLVVTRVGDGSAALTNASTVVFLDEYTPTGTLVQSIAMPTTVSGANKRFMFSGSATSEGYLRKSTDGRYLTLMGYDADAGIASIAATTSATTNRVVALVDWNGNVNTSTALADAYSAGNPRCAVTKDGAEFWLTGTGTGTGAAATGGNRYCLFGLTASTLLSENVTNVRTNLIFGNQLYCSTMSGAFRGVSTVGSPPPPSTTGNTVSLLTGFDPSATSTQSVYDFWFKDANTLYVADDRTHANGGGLQKWTFNAGTWTKIDTFQGGLPGSTGIRGMTGKVNGSGNAEIYVITGGSPIQIMKIVDDGSGSALLSFSSIATVATNTAFRGIAFAPEDSGPVSVAPTTFDIAPGTLVSGGIPELTNSDNSRLHAKLNPTSEDTGFPVQLNIEATSPTATPTSFQFTLECFVEIDGIEQYVELWDWTNNNWVRVSQVFSSSTSDLTVTGTANGTLSRFVRNGDKRVRARCGWDAVAADVDIVWFVKIDQAIWKIGQ